MQPQGATLCDECGSKLPRAPDDVIIEAESAAPPSAPAQGVAADRHADSEPVLDLRSEHHDTSGLEPADVAMATVGALTRAAATISAIEAAVQRSPSAENHRYLDLSDRTVQEEADRPVITPSEPQVGSSAEAPDKLPEAHAIVDMDPIATVARHSARWFAGTLVLVIVLASIVIGLGYVVELYMHS